MRREAASDIRMAAVGWFCGPISGCGRPSEALHCPVGWGAARPLSAPPPAPTSRPL